MFFRGRGFSTFLIVLVDGRRAAPTEDIILAGDGSLGFGSLKCVQYAIKTWSLNYKDGLTFHLATAGPAVAKGLSGRSSVSGVGIHSETPSLPRGLNAIFKHAIETFERYSPFVPFCRAVWLNFDHSILLVLNYKHRKKTLSSEKLNQSLLTEYELKE